MVVTHGGWIMVVDHGGGSACMSAAAPLENARSYHRTFLHTHVRTTHGYKSLPFGTRKALLHLLECIF